MPKKIFTVLLALSLSLSASSVLAEEGEYTALGETGIQIRLAPGFEKQQLSEEDLREGVVVWYALIFAEGAEGKHVTAVYDPEETRPLEECIKEYREDPFYSDVSILETEAGLEFLCFTLGEERPVRKVVEISLGEKGYLDIIFEPYADEEDTETVDAMIRSLRAGE